METCLLCHRSFSIIGTHVISHKISLKIYYHKWVLKSYITPKCKKCNKVLLFNKLSNPYPTFCSRSCRSSFTLSKTHRENTLFSDANKERFTQVITNLHKDPLFKERKYQRDSERFKNLHKDDSFIDKMTPIWKETALKRNKDPDDKFGQSDHSFGPSSNEYMIKNKLDEYNILYIHQFINFTISRRKPDFYLPEYNIFLEVDLHPSKYINWKIPLGLDNWVTKRKIEVEDLFGTPLVNIDWIKYDKLTKDNLLSWISEDSQDYYLRTWINSYDY